MAKNPVRMIMLFHWIFACGWSFDLMLSCSAAFALALTVPMPSEMGMFHAA